MRRVSLTALTLAFTLSATIASAEIKIALVDMQRALHESKAGEASERTLKAIKARYQADLDARQTELKNLQHRPFRCGDFLPPEVRARREAVFRKKLGALQMLYAQVQRKLAAHEATLKQRIFGRIGRILAKMGKAQGLSMIFEATQSSIAWAPRGLDLTDEVIRRLDGGEGRSKPKKTSVFGFSLQRHLPGFQVKLKARQTRQPAMNQPPLSH